MQICNLCNNEIFEQVTHSKNEKLLVCSVCGNPLTQEAQDRLKKQNKALTIAIGFSIILFGALFFFDPILATLSALGFILLVALVIKVMQKKGTFITIDSMKYKQYRLDLRNKNKQSQEELKQKINAEIQAQKSYIDPKTKNIVLFSINYPGLGSQCWMVSEKIISISHAGRSGSRDILISAIHSISLENNTLSFDISGKEPNILFGATPFSGVPDEKIQVSPQELHFAKEIKTRITNFQH